MDIRATSKRQPVLSIQILCSTYIIRTACDVATEWNPFLTHRTKMQTKPEKRGLARYKFRVFENKNQSQN